MRDLLVASIILGSLPVIFYRPYIGVIMWTWISLMSPHRLAWGFAYDFPWAKIVGAVTIVAVLISTQRRRFPWTRETALLAFFVLWMLLTTLFALSPSSAWEQWDKVSKIQLVILITMVVLTNRTKLEQFVWMIVLSIGFYGIKGGIFTIAKGGQSAVLGPPGSFISDNNHLGLALIMVIPLMRYLQLQQPRRWVRLGLGGAIVLTSVATLGTQSRGAFLGLAAMLAFLAMKSRRRIVFLLAAIVLVPAFLSMMPQSWHDRMASIQDYEQDSSAVGRLNSWGFATNVALDRPLVGGGFNVFSERWFRVYAPDPNDFHDAHSVYFEVLGEHGFAGLLLFFAIAATAWRTCSWLIRTTKKDPDLAWFSDLGKMCQVAMFGYAAAGAFVGLAYFDLYYNVIAIVVIAKLMLLEELRSREELEPARRDLRVRRLAPALN